MGCDAFPQTSVPDPTTATITWVEQLVISTTTLPLEEAPTVLNFNKEGRDEDQFSFREEGSPKQTRLFEDDASRRWLLSYICLPFFSPKYFAFLSKLPQWCRQKTYLTSKALMRQRR